MDSMKEMLFTIAKVGNKNCNWIAKRKKVRDYWPGIGFHPESRMEKGKSSLLHPGLIAN